MVWCNRQKLEDVQEELDKVKDLYIQTCQDLSQQEEALRSQEQDLEQAIAAGTAPIWFSELTKNISNIVNFLRQAGYCCISVWRFIQLQLICKHYFPSHNGFEITDLISNFCLSTHSSFNNNMLLHQISYHFFVFLFCVC